MTPNTEYTYELKPFYIVQDAENDGSMTLHKNIAAIELMANVRVQRFKDHTLRIKLENVQFGRKYELIKLNNLIENYEAGVLRIDADKYSEEELQRLLEKPVIIQEKRDKFVNLIVSQSEPESLTNIKKYVISLLQNDVTDDQLKLVKKTGIFVPLKLPSNPRISKLELFM